MIRSITANDPRFKPVHLRPGLNVLLADTTEGSTAQDTRNGVGKSLLMQVLHFCLGSSAPRSGALTSPALVGWMFTTTLELRGSVVEVTRALGSPQTVGVAGDFDAWGITPTWDDESGSFRLTVDEWRTVLGAEMFALTDVAGYRYKPTFRMLFSYFARFGAGAYQTPFRFFATQREWQKQVSVAYLLELAWEHAARYQELKDQREALRTLKRAMEQGAFGDPEQSVGRLRTQRVRLISQIEALEAQLDDFEVHPEYQTIAEEANELTERIHVLVNARVIRERTVALYEEQAEIETGPGADAIVELFERARVELSHEVKRGLVEAEEFHSRVVANRRAYLSDEIETLRREDEGAAREIEALSHKRAHLMEILETKHALEEFLRLTERLSELRAELANVDAQISRIGDIEERQASLEITAQELARDARRELAEREPAWSEAIELFAANTDYLYGTPGELVIDLNDNGYTFDVNIERSGSHGVNNMKIFAFDLMLAQRWSGKSHGPRLLWHDSELFDGVDERQVGAALQLAARESEVRGFQYFCSLNSDDLPPDEFLGGLSVEPVLRLTDASDDAGLFGMRF
jgi:uncharacterized protein YydD (DUF2326 family)